MIDRRKFMGCAGALLLPPALLPGAASGQAARRPNILVLIADDWSYPHASALGDPVVKTPAFDRIVREGVLFRNAFVTAPSCTPSRAALATGQHHWRLKGAANLWGSLPQSVSTYQDLLQQAGYFAGYSAKGIAPTNNIHRATDPCGKRFRNFASFMQARPRGAPWSFWFGCGDPHRPYEAGMGVEAGLNPEKVKVPACLPEAPAVRSDLCDYYAEVQRFDSSCGDILKRLEATGELDDTLIVMTSDNGMPFPRFKATLYDGGTRVPLAIRWPRKREGGGKIGDFVTLCDLAPTFLQAAGLPVPADMTGGSLMYALEANVSGTMRPERDHVLFGLEQHILHRPRRAIRTRDFLYVRNLDVENWPNVEGEWIHAVDPSPTKTYLLEHRDDPVVRPLHDLAFTWESAEELYDLKQDPDQLRNVAADPAYAPAKEKLALRLDERLKATGDPRMFGAGDKFARYRKK